jgi:N-dimethylarginine dimethylaminohydrolase
MGGVLRRVVVRRPTAAFAVGDPERWNYVSTPDLEIAVDEHDGLVALLTDDGVEIVHHDVPLPDHADAIFVHDPVLVTDTGTVVLRMGKELRRGEEAPLAATLETAGVPVAGRLEAPAVAEGGDLLWLDHDTLAAGQGFRTNAAALDQLRDLLPGVEVIPVPLPYHGGPAACLHLMSLVSVVAPDVAVLHRPLLPVIFLDLLERRGFRLVDVPAEELATHGTNVLATAPGRCIALEGNPVTASGLTAAGCDVRTYRGNEITLKAEGGATCLTRPIWRT